MRIPDEADSSCCVLTGTRNVTKISVSFPEGKVEETKRGVLRKHPSIYDLLENCSTVKQDGGIFLVS